MFLQNGLRSTRVTSRTLYGMLIFIFFTLLSSILFQLLIPSFNAASNPCAILNKQFYQISRRYFVNNSQNTSGYQNNYGYHQNNNVGANDVSAQFSYKTAVAFQPKDRDDQIYKKLKDSLLSATGEDNYFVNDSNEFDIFAGVADGVGGWAEHGFDSSAISRELCKAMHYISSTISNKKNIQKDKNEETVISPKELIKEAYDKIKDEKIVKVGGTTAIAAHMDKKGKLRVANLGDSWCGVFRNSKVVFQTKFQTVGFNAPYQLSIIPEEMEFEAKKSGRSYIQNTPKDADEYEFQLDKNDVVILATDGVTDNIAVEDIEIFLNDNKENIESDLHSVSKTLVNNVVKISKDPEFPSVFAQEISKITGKLYKGGKEDDITLIMVKVE